MPPRKPTRRRVRQHGTRTNRPGVKLPSPLVIASLAAAIGLLVLLLRLPWYLLIAALVVLVVTGHDGLLWWKARQRRLLRVQAQAQSDVERIWCMTGTEFEYWTAGILQAWCGWQTATVRGGSGDLGVDIIGRNARGELCVVQCKRQKQLVDREVVQSIYANIAHHNAQRAYLVTTSGISDKTRPWIGEKPIEIWDGAYLKRLLAHHRLADDTPGMDEGLLASGWLPRYWKPLLGGLAAWCLLLLVLTSSWSIRATPQTTSYAAPTAVPRVASGERMVEVQGTSDAPMAEGVVALTSDVRLAREARATAPIILQLRAGDQIKLMTRTVDSAWVQVRSTFGIDGWLPRAALIVDPALVQRLPVN